MIIGNILIIDDEKIIAEAMKDTLEDVNYNVVLAADAQQAKIIVKNQTFDLIMMDVWMPGQDGMSLLEEWMSAGFSMPVVMMSGHAGHQDVVKAIKLGAVDFLKKPLHDILPLVRKLLSENINDDEQKINGINFDLPLKVVRNIFEAQYFDYHLAQNNHNIAKVAELAGLERTTLYRKLKDLGIDKK
ncbi:response regulator [bacterium endosymbiont of Bathymodiolus sp. 5 South]|jgi:DNA-binding NtrC family response regulator|uniref:response regulator n=1 Tax=bacterium endosymbiont of Bathymodiolus sp. 5 South TaxID=1181670 RepID=UPI0010B305CA|nr:response regulator [bacterium endosymbiont of Bathymodiolus sp. 5 South]CAC9640238.1 Two-component transcriptional response regulator, LuxR family [uncultured Gammaproteobacteria bacterium]SHN90543.1 DNA-binding response regulator [bacterium endosymbiont of Bathymodiolus sp. 5 South]SSC07058.1 Response regulator containing CheY-like receiver, AAA-type ATPase, and DNA-binding domains [bacterium endosymbiont of Bathymodiolus sp. 5 South]VVH59586.1 DNA-binding response regulator [uncultured Gam